MEVAYFMSIKLSNCHSNLIITTSRILRKIKEIPVFLNFIPQDYFPPSFPICQCKALFMSAKCGEGTVRLSVVVFVVF